MRTLVELEGLIENLLADGPATAAQLVERLYTKLKIEATIEEVRAALAQLSARDHVRQEGIDMKANALLWELAAVGAFCCFAGV